MAEVVKRVHIFTRAKQPLLRYVDTNLRSMGFSQRRSTIHNNPRKLFRCCACGKRRWAQNLGIQVYYDQLVITCMEGCKEK
jgi:hypothetical protein